MPEGSLTKGWRCFGGGGSQTRMVIIASCPPHLTTDMSIACLSMNFNFSSRSQYCGPTGRPPLGSWSNIKSLSSNFPSRVVERMKGTQVRDRNNEVYLGRYTWVCMSTKSLDAMIPQELEKKRKDVPLIRVHCKQASANSESKSCDLRNARSANIA